MLCSAWTTKKFHVNYPTISLDLLAVRGVLPHTSPPRPLILVVDDEVTIAQTLRTIIMQHGFASLALGDARSALELIRVVPPDLLLTDFGLPGMNGLELALHVAEICPACKIILFSGLVSAADMAEMCPAPGPEFVLLEKPMHPNGLLARIDSLLQPSTPANHAAPLPTASAPPHRTATASRL